MDQIFNFLLKYIGLVLFIAAWIAVPVLLFKAYKTKRIREWLENQDYRLIKISVPKENEKGPLAAEQMFASLHGIFKPLLERNKEGSLQEHISFEIASSSEKISFYVWVPTHLKDFVEGQIYAQYSKAEFEEVTDYTERDFSDYHVVGTEIIMNKNDVLPIKTFVNFEEVDPLSGITSVLAKIDEPGEDIWIQILAKPVDDSWQDRGRAFVNAIKEGRSPSSSPVAAKLMAGATNFLRDLAKAAVTPPEQMAVGAPVKLASGDEAKIKAVEEKISKLGFEIKIRVGYITKKADLSVAKIKLRSVIGAFKQFNTVNLNGFQAGATVIGEQFLNEYRSRLFNNGVYVLNIEELASIFHLPNVSVETPRINWTGSSKGAPPDNLPILDPNDPSTHEVAPFAETTFRNKNTAFGIKIDDRRRHMYIIGKTGVGKTNMMENLIISDIKAGRGVAVIDPHGELVNSVLTYIPEERVNDVILFDPADSKHPIAFNLLETVDSDQKQLIASGLVSIFHKIWKDSWGPRLEYILRNTILSLLDYPDSTMMGILRILVDKKYRHAVIEKLQDPVIYDFWTKEFEQYNERTRVDAILPIQNKVGQFLSSPTIRNIVGQPKSKIDIADIMNNKKILLIRLSQGQIGEDNTALLGAMMITKMQLTAMSRVTIPEEQRQDFYLYVDEFQNFATESFAKILSEARKYKLNLTVANQYISQLTEEVRDAIFGNIGTIVSFRVGADDSRFLAKEFEPVFDENDLVNLDKYHIYLKLAIDGITGNAFSAKTIKIPDQKEDNEDKILAISRERYSVHRDLVEQKLNDWSKQQQEAVNTTASLDDKDQEEKVEYDKYRQYLTTINNASGKTEIKEVKISKASYSENIEKPKLEVKESQQVATQPDKKDRIKELTSKMISSSKKIELEEDDLGGLSKEEFLKIKNRLSDLASAPEKVGDSSISDDNNSSRHELKPGQTIKFE